jgi:hypothetical protein
MQRMPDTKPMPAITPPPGTLLARSGVSRPQTGQRAQFQERRTRVQQQRQALARQQLAALLEAFARGRRFQRGPSLDFANPPDQFEHAGAIGLEGVAAGGNG